MAHVQFTHDAPVEPIDASLEAAGSAAVNVGRPIRCRLQPYLYDWPNANFGAWRGLTWTIECQDVGEGRRLREGLASFFKAFGGTERQQARLLALLSELAEKVRS